MIFHGLPISSGVALAPAYLYEQVDIQVPREPVAPHQTAAELARYADGRAAAAEQLRHIHDLLLADAPDKAAIFQAHMDILRDAAMIEEIEDMICQLGTNAADAVDTVYTQYAELIGALEDPVMRERAADLVDVRTRLLCCLLRIRRTTLAEIAEPSVLVAHELLPSDTAVMSPDMVCGIVTEEGGTTSHSAILARSLGIPAVSGIPNALQQIKKGQMVAIHAAEGLVESEPDDLSRQRYRQLLAQFRQEQELDRTCLPLVPVTAAGTRIHVCLNLASGQDPAMAYADVSDGVGLLRSEFLYMQSSTLPDEEAQVQAYIRVAERFGEKQVIIRTLDIGGDKQVAALPMEAEANPFLGNRALRLCFDRPELFRTQLRAILRAAVHGNLAIMFPMVGSMDDLRRARQALEEAKASLAAEAIPFRGDIPVGIMIEIPAIAMMASQAAEEVDFASIGTNDLCQYLLAADRMNPQVAPYYQSYHPAMFRLIAHVQHCFETAGKTVSVCGELGAEPMAVLALMSLGMKKFSMSAGAMAAIKRLVCNVTEMQLQKARESVYRCTTARELEAELRAILQTI